MKTNIGKKILAIALASVLALKGSTLVYDLFGFLRTSDVYISGYEKKITSLDFPNTFGLLSTSGILERLYEKTLLSFIPNIALASYPTTAYAPGDTLDPSCSPGDANCTVNELPNGSDKEIQYNNGGSFGGASNFYYASTTGSVGIGTSSPYALLSVTGQVVANYFTATSTTATSTFSWGVQANALSVTSASASSTFANGINLSAGCFAINGTCVGAGSSQWTTSGSNIYYNTGNVGIGTTTPYAKLSVVGEVVAPYYTATSTTATSTFANALSVGTTTSTSTAKLAVDGGLFITDSIGSIAIGNTSLSATGTRAVSVGISNFAGGTDSTALGTKNKSFSPEAIAIGRLNTASGDTAATAIGYSNTSSALASAAFGISNTANNTSANAFGSGNTASAYYASAFGYSNTASSYKASAFGHGNTASNYHTSSFGRGNTASGIGSQAFGYLNTASGSYSAALGLSVNNSIANSAQFGASNVAKLTILSTGETQAPFFTATTTNATSTFTRLAAEVLHVSTTTATSSFAWGVNIKGGCFAINGTCVGGGSGGAFTSAGGYTTLNTATDNVGIGTSTPYAKLSVVGEVVAPYYTATSTTATSTFANALSVSTTTSDANNAKLFVDGKFKITSSNGAVIIGDTSGNARGTGSLDIQSTRSAATQVASMSSSVAVGKSNTVSGASGVNSVAIGIGNNVSITGVASTGGDAAVGVNNSISGYNTEGRSAFGVSNTSSAYQASAFGYNNTASNNQSVAFGYGNTTSSQGSASFGLNNSVNGVCGAIAVGYANTVSGYGAVVFGRSITNSIDASTQVGVTDSAKLTILSTGETKAPFFTATTTNATSTFTRTQVEILDVSTTTATSTVHGNLRVQGTLRATVSYVGDLVFANNFRFVEGPLEDSTQYLSLQDQNHISRLAIADTGNVGIGTTSPEYKLHVLGDVAATAFVNTSTREAKTDISYLTKKDYQGFLDKLADINVATYRYKTEATSTPTNRLGLIAEEAPSEVLSVNGDGVDVYKLTSFTLGATKALSEKVANLEIKLRDIESLKTSGGSLSVSSVLSAFENLGLRIVDGVTYMRALVIGTPEKPTGIVIYDDVTHEPYCVKVSNGSVVTVPGTCDVETSPTSTENTNEDTTPPVITLNGLNPSVINKGESYIDLGATVTDNINQNLGITVTGDQIDTSIVGEYTITYTATDQALNTATTTRTVIVRDPSTSSGQATDNPTETPEETPNPDDQLPPEEVVEPPVEEPVVPEPVDESTTTPEVLNTETNE